ncbi:MAG: hypothetical protein JWQ87_529 [Candidatus Sulfotelmatobacter sp.]|nr:hypothetical protein [Candidatus Sulfotelmatobacter sp.]
MFDPEDTLTHEEIVSRFKKLFKREMTIEEKRGFFLHEFLAEQDPERSAKAAKRH